MLKMPIDRGFERELKLLKQESLLVHCGSDISQNSIVSDFQVVMRNDMIRNC